jgi:rod shape-determining protein MreD
MKWPPLILGTLGMTLLQTSAIPAFELLGVAPNLLLVALCCWAVVRDPREALVLVPLAGIWIGLLSNQGMAESIAAFVPLVVVASLRGPIQPPNEYAWALSVIIVATLLHFLAVVAALQLEGASIDWIAAIRDVAVPSILTNLFIGAIVYWLVRLPTPHPETT